MALDDMLDPVEPIPLSQDLRDDEERNEAIVALQERTERVIGEMRADRHGHQNAARIEALVEEAQARHDKLAAIREARHRETVALNDRYEMKTGIKAAYAIETSDPSFVDPFERFVRQERERVEAKANAEAEREAATARAARAEAEAAEARQVEAQRAHEDEHRAWRHEVRHRLRAGAPGVWTAPESSAKLRVLGTIAPARSRGV